jgi:hypothetical protein
MFADPSSCTSIGHEAAPITGCVRVFIKTHYCILLHQSELWRPCLAVSHRVRTMIAKLIVREGLASRRKAAGPGRRASMLAVTGIALLLFVGRTVGTADERPPTTQVIAPVPPSAATDSSGDPTSTGSIAISGPGQAPGQWLIDDIATNRAASELKGASPKSIGPTVATPDAVPAEAHVGFRSLNHMRTGRGQHRRAEVTGSTARPPASNEHSVSIRPNTSLRPDDAARNCTQAPGSLAPKDGQWHYRLDLKTQRKCWYVRASRQDDSRARRRQSTSADPAGTAKSSGTAKDTRDTSWVWH